MQIGEKIANNSSYYFLLEVGNRDWEEWWEIAFGWNPEDFINYMKEYFTTFDI
jgi:hypothetical protein